MANVKVRYHLEEILTFSGVMEIDEDLYAEYKDQDEEILGEFILEMIDPNRPDDHEIESVDEFKRIDG